MVTLSLANEQKSVFRWLRNSMSTYCLSYEFRLRSRWSFSARWQLGGDWACSKSNHTQSKQTHRNLISLYTRLGGAGGHSVMIPIYGSEQGIYLKKHYRYQVNQFRYNLAGHSRAFARANFNDERNCFLTDMFASSLASIITASRTAVLKQLLNSCNKN